MQRVLAEIDGDAATAIRPFPGWNWKAAALPLAACLALGFFLFFRGSSQPVHAVATVRDLAGEVHVRSLADGELRPLTAGSSLHPGDTVICGAGGVVTTDYANGSAVSLMGGRLRFDGPNGEGGNSVVLESGRALCRLASHAPEDIPVTFQTPHAGGCGSDATFELFVNELTTRVRSLAGDVRVWNRGDSPNWAPVSVGSAAVLRNGAPLRAATFAIDQLNPGDVVWVQDFDTHFQNGADIEGRLLMLREGARLTTLLRSIPTTELNREPEFSPDQWMSIELASRQALFQLPEDPELILWIRAARPGAVRVALNPEDPRIEAEHVISEAIPVGTDWKRIIVRADDLKPFKDSRPASKGLLVRSVALWGFDTGEVQLDRVLVRRGVAGKN